MASAVENFRSADLLGKWRRRHLILIFCAWKGLLLLLSAFCPGPGYDTSGLVLFNPSARRHDELNNASRTDRLAINLLRWDAIYFVKAGERGHIFEQEWAFSWANSHLLRAVEQYVPSSLDNPLRSYIVAGVVLSLASHLLSVLVLYGLLTVILDRRQQGNVAFVASVLHVMTPASLFYCAPYSEALFSLLNLTGMLLYALSKASATPEGLTLTADAYMLGSGVVFALATLIRSNGLLSGLIFLYDVTRYLPRIISGELSFWIIRKVAVTCIAGISIALGFLFPQYLAYKEFCGHKAVSPVRPWCEKTLPSIYSFVQSHYWNVGLFRYWTLSNLPLFLIAAPILWLMLVSSVTVLRSYNHGPSYGLHIPQGVGTIRPSRPFAWVHSLPELALPQLVLAIAAITSFHVQITNRIASAYPTWYVMVAGWLVSEQAKLSSAKSLHRDQWIVRGLIIYALVQGMLYANFLPPA